MPASSTSLFEDRKTCRLCTSTNLTVAVPMVPIPQGDGYVPPARKHEVERLFPHDIKFCKDCGNLQTGIDVHQGFIYDHYLWTTSISPGLTALYQKYADQVVSRFFPNNKGFAVELGSNDGTFSKFLQGKGLTVLAVDPAKNLAEKATAAGVETWAEFFGPAIAEKIRAERGEADMIVANHMFANINDVDVITEGVLKLLSKDGVFVIQVFYLYDVLKDNLLENFNHEHPSYLYVRTLKQFFNRFGLELFDVEHVPAKGGSIRCFIQRKGAGRSVTPAVGRMIDAEERLGLHKLESYRSLANHIEMTRKKFRDFLDECRAQGKRVAAYGTSIGATVFTYQYGLGKDLEFFVDDDSVRHGLVTPGYHIPVLSPDAIYERKPDYVVVMAPLYADIIIGKHKKFAEQGGRFVKFRPDFQIV